MLQRQQPAFRRPQTFTWTWGALPQWQEHIRWDIFTVFEDYTKTTYLFQTIAEIYEAQTDFDRGMKHYELAADFFKGEDSNSSAKKCMVKLAELSAQFEKYETAIGIYEQVIQKNSSPMF